MAESEDRIRDSSSFSDRNGNTDGSVDESSIEQFGLMHSYFDQHFKSLKRELREELHSSSTSTLKRFKDVSSSKGFKYRSNKKQFVFNLDVIEGLDDIKEATKRGEQNKVLELSEALRKKVFHKNKLIRIADKSAGGWDTVKEYESDDLASDSDDDKRLKRAESRALAKLKSKQPRKPVSATPSPGFADLSGSSI